MMELISIRIDLVLFTDTLCDIEEGMLVDGYSAVFNRITYNCIRMDEIRFMHAIINGKIEIWFGEFVKPSRSWKRLGLIEYPNDRLLEADPALRREKQGPAARA